MKKYEQRITEVTLLPEGENLFSEMANTIKICDEAGGEFVEVRQNISGNDNYIKIDVLEWEDLKEAIDRMIKDCRM